MKFCPLSNKADCDSVLLDERQLQDRHAGSVEGQHIRWRDTRRQQLQHGLRGGGDLRQRSVDVDAGLEEDLDHTVTGQRLRFDMLDIIDLRRQRSLIVINDAS